LSNKIAVILIFSSFFVFNRLNSQPNATFQLLGGYSLPLGDYEGTFGETQSQFTHNGNPDSNSYFMKSGSNYGFVVKIAINKKTLPLNFVGSLLSNSFGQKKEYSGDSSYTSVNLSQTITTFGIGIEYTMAGKKTIFNPFIMAQITLNLFSGQYIEYDGEVTTTLNLYKTVRGGIQLGAGMDYVLHNNVGVCIGVRYSFDNLIGKSTGQNTPGNYNLNDAAHEESDGFYDAKNITYLQFFGGVSFYFGR